MRWLTSGTTYDYTVGVSNQCGDAQDTGSFTTANAPTNEFVGWTSAFSSNGFELDQIGAGVDNPGIFVQARCYTGTPYSPTVGPVNLSIYQTTSGNYYTAFYPALEGYTWYTSLNIPGNALVTLSSNGVCYTNYGADDFGMKTNVSNPHILLEAQASGYWNATAWIPSEYSVTNDYRQFGLMPNAAQPVQVGLAIVHTTYSACSFKYWTSTIVSTVQQVVGVDSYSGLSESQSSGESWNSPGGWGSDNALNLIYPFQGVTNETQTTSPGVLSVPSVAGAAEGPSAIPITTTDWVTLITTPPDQQLPTGWHLARPNSGQTESDPLSEKIYGYGTYTNESGLVDDFSVSLGWEGASYSNSYSIQATTTITTTIGTTASCSFAYSSDPSGNGGSPYFYYYDGATSGTGAAIPSVEVWLVGYCGGADEVDC